MTINVVLVLFLVNAISGETAEYADIIAPNSMELLGSGDVIFISSAQDVMEKLMKSIAGESKGLFILQSNVLALPGYGSELVECVISDTNPFLGKQLGSIASEFAEKYKSSVITARGRHLLPPALTSALTDD